MNISKEVKLITPRVRDHRDYTDMIFDLTIFIDVTDLDTNSTIGYQLFHQFDTEIEYTEENPFVPFDDITEEQVNSLINTLIDEERVGGQWTLDEWAERRFSEIYSEPVSKPFLFQIGMESETVGLGT
jgi:hypothetical protein